MTSESRIVLALAEIGYLANLGTRASRAIRSYSRIIPAGQSCVACAPFQRGASLTRVTHVPNVR